MNSSDFRAELEKIMPGYSWTVHQNRTGKWLRENTRHPGNADRYRHPIERQQPAVHPESLGARTTAM